MTSQPSLNALAEKITADARLTLEDGVQLLAHPNPIDLGPLAQQFLKHIGAGEAVTYSAALRVERAEIGEKPDEVLKRLDALTEAGGKEVYFTGKRLKESDFTTEQNYLRELRRHQPGVEVVGFTAGEIIRLAKRQSCSVEGVLKALKADGLAALGPFVCEDDSSAFAHLEEKGTIIELLGAARSLGLPVTVQLCLPPSESPEERIRRLLQVRQVQEATGAITTLTPLNREPSGMHGYAFDYLRIIAAARLIAHNVPHIQASWEAHGLKIAQMALQYGADDLGVFWLETASGSPTFSEPIHEIERNIAEAGFSPRARNARYEAVEAPHIPVPAEPITFGSGLG